MDVLEQFWFDERSVLQRASVKISAKRKHNARLSLQVLFTYHYR